MKYGIKLYTHSQTSTVAPLKFGNGKLFHPTHYWTCDYISMLGLKLNHISKRGHRKLLDLNKSSRNIHITQLTLNMLNCFKNDKKVYSHFLSYLGFWSTEEDQIHNGGILPVADATPTILCLLITWRLKEPGHQQALYWPNKPEY